MKKTLFMLAVLMILACPVMAAMRQFQVVIVDENGKAVTNIDQIEIYDAGTGTTSTIYTNRAGDVEIANPITTATSNSTFVQSLGLVSWFQSAATFKITITEDGASQTLTADNLDSTDGRIAWFVNYLGEAATLQVGDDTTLDIGGSDDFIHDWDNNNSRYVIYPASDDSGTLHFGKAAVHMDLFWHTGAAVTDDYVQFDEGSALVLFKDVDLVLDSSAVLFFGDSSDMSMNYDESGNDLDILSTSAMDCITFGASADSYDLEWFGAAASDTVLFDASENEIYLTDIDIMWDDDADAIFGSGEDWVIDCKVAKTLLMTPNETDGTNVFAIGTVANTSDVLIYGEAASTVVFDAGTDVVLFDVYNIALGDGDQLLFGDTLGTGDFSISDESDKLIITQVSDGVGSVEFSADGEGMDVTFWGDTSSSKMLWDENGDTNGSLIITGGSQTITGINGGGNLLTITGIDQSGNSDTVVITHKGTGAGIKVTAGETDSVAANFIAAAAQTTSLAVFDGATGADWRGAANVGMLHITSDGALANVASSLVYIANSGVPQNDSRGSSLRIVDTGNAAAGTAGYAVYISATDATVEAMIVDDGDVLIDENLTVTGNLNRVSEQYVQTIAYAKLGSSGAGWTIGAADDKSLATLVASQTAEIIIVPITIPLKVGWTITAWTINGQIDSAGNTATLDAKLYKHTEATAGEATAAIGSGMAQLSKTADYKVVDGESSLTEVVAADEAYFMLITGTTAGTTDIEIASITVTVTEI